MIDRLQNNLNQEVDSSRTFPFLLKTKLYEFLTQAAEDEIAVEQQLRQWIATL